MYVCVSECVCGHMMCAGAKGDQRCQFPPEMELTGICKLPDMGAGS